MPKTVVSYKYTMGKMLSPCVTVPAAVARSFSHHTVSEAQPTERETLQSAILSQAINSSLPLPPTSVATTSTTTSTAPQTTPHLATSLLVVQSSQNHPNSTVALPNAGDTTLTKSIRAEEAGEAFREHRADLLEAVVDPLILANSLYSKKIISRETLKQIMELSLTFSNKNVILLDAVEARIRTHPSDFLILLAILGSDAHLCVYAEGLRNSYCEVIVIINNIFYSLCPSLAGMDTRLCCQVGHRDASLIVK